MLALISELGLSTYPTNVTGGNVYYRDGNVQTYTGTIPPAQPAALVELATLIGDINKMAAEVPRRRAPDRAARGRVGLADVRDLEAGQRPHDEARELARPRVQLGVRGRAARRLAALHALLHRHGGQLQPLINTAGGAQEDRIVGGSQRIALKLAEQLGKRVRLEQPVHLIERNGMRVEVTGAKRDLDGEAGDRRARARR